jgi:hypothetical protein
MMGFVTDTFAADPFSGESGAEGGGSVDVLLGADRAGMVDGERSGDLLALERVRCRVDHEVLVQLGRWDAGQAWSADGSSSGAAWMAPRLGITGADARERVKVARWCRQAPEVLAALAACRLTYSKVVVFARFVTEACLPAFERDGEMLVRHASGLRVEDVTRMLRHWATYADPEGAEDAEAARQDQRAVYLAETFGGMGDLRGNLTPEGLALAETLLDRVMGELYRDEARGDVPERTPAQRRHDAFLEVLRRAAAWDPQNGRQAHPTLLFLLGEDAIATHDDEPTDHENDDEGEPAEPGDAAPTGSAAPGGVPTPTTESEVGGDDEDQPAAGGVLVTLPDLDDLTDHDVPAPCAGPSAGPVPDGPAGPSTDTGSGPAQDARSGALDGEHDRDSGRPAAGRPGRGRGDPVEASPPPRFLFGGASKATLWDGPPISNETVRRLTCDAEVARLVLDAEGEVLDHGRSKRLFTPAQRRAILARYGNRCGWPDCDRPAGWLQIHHLDEWDAHGGLTDIDNGWPGCGTHHRCVHEGGHQIRRDPTTRQLTYWRPDGTQIFPTNPNTALFDAG